MIITPAVVASYHPTPINAVLVSMVMLCLLRADIGRRLRLSVIEPLE